MRLDFGLFSTFEIYDLPSHYLAHLLSHASLPRELQKAIQREFNVRRELKKKPKKRLYRPNREAA